MTTDNEKEGLCCENMNTGIITAMKEMYDYEVVITSGNIVGVFAGHHHNDDFFMDYKGLVFGYGRKTGYGSYGPPKQCKVEVLYDI